MFISFLHMFRATMCPSLAEITVFMWHFIFVKHQVLHRYSYFCRWWAHSRPKRVEKRKTVHQVGFIYKKNFLKLLHRYSYFCRWWAHSCPKRVEKRKTVHQVGFIYKKNFLKFFLRNRPTYGIEWICPESIIITCII